MKEHNPVSKGESITIECVENGYVVSYQRMGYFHERKVFENYSQVVNFIAHQFLLAGIGEDVIPLRLS